MDVRKIADQTRRFWDDVAAIPQIARNKVWCTTCGREQSLSGISAMQNGWPKCCGYTMTIDSPAERAALTGSPR